MAKIISDGKVPNEIEEFVIYSLDGDVICKKKTGFTKAGMANAAKYAKSRQNASEFGARMYSLLSLMGTECNSALSFKGIYCVSERSGSYLLIVVGMKLGDCRIATPKFNHVPFEKEHFGHLVLTHQTKL